MAKHTPGPWITEANGPAFNLSQEGMPHHMILVGMVSNALGKHLANSKLIAAAPELLEALKLLVQLHEKASDVDYMAKIESTVEVAKAAIAKATE